MEKIFFCCLIICTNILSSRAQLSVTIQPDLSFPIQKTDEIGSIGIGLNSKVQYQVVNSAFGIGYGIEKLKDAFSDDFLHSFNCNYSYTFSNHFFLAMEAGVCKRKIKDELINATQSSTYIYPEIGIKKQFSKWKNLYYQYSLGYFLPLEGKSIVTLASNYPKRNISLIKLGVGLTYVFNQ